MADQDVLRFPKGFRWGAATSSHQVEGVNSNNDWWAWEHSRGKILGGHRSGAACDWWAGMAEEDFDRAAQTCQNTHRLSIEWSRIEPRQGEWDEAALDRYRRMIRGLRDRGLEPLVTLHHFTNPLWLAGIGGWANERVVSLFQRYARRVVEALREDVDFWCTINEPNVYLFGAYVSGDFPPGGSLRQASAVAVNLARAHAAVYHTIHGLQAEARVGLAVNLRLFDPANPSSPIDRFLAAQHHRLFNEMFVQAAHDGRLLTMAGHRWVGEAAGTMDYLGVNYYTRDMVAFALRPGRAFTRRFPAPGAPISNGGYGEIYPGGMLRALQWAERFGLPVYVTENGLPDARDARRPGFIIRHLYEVWRAIQGGIPVRGYYHWSLVDNFEWERGWTQRFGLWALDTETQRRSLRRSGEVYAEICRSNGLPRDLIREYAPELAFIP